MRTYNKPIPSFHLELDKLNMEIAIFIDRLKDGTIKTDSDYADVLEYIGSKLHSIVDTDLKRQGIVRE